MPRVGFAFAVTPKTVVHAGYGIYYSAPNVTNSSGLSNNTPAIDYWAFNNGAVYGAGSNGLAFNYASNGFAHQKVTSVQNLPAGLPVQAQDPQCENSLQRAVALDGSTAAAIRNSPERCLRGNEGSASGQPARH